MKICTCCHQNITII